MFRSRQELIDKILDNLGILVPGQSPGEEDNSRVDDIIDPGLETLAALGIIYIAEPGTPDPPSGGAIPNNVYLPLSRWLAREAAPAFNLAGDPAIDALAERAELILRTIGRPASTRQVLKTDAQLRGNRTRVPVGNFTRGT